MGVEPFHGAKLAILSGDRIVTILRDDKPGIPWPGMWDLPGGGREGHETPADCVLRETQEELGLRFRLGDLHWRAEWPSGSSRVWLFVTEQPAFDSQRVRFGDEGQRWELWSIERYLTDSGVIPHQKSRLKVYLANRARVLADVARGQPLGR